MEKFNINHKDIIPRNIKLFLIKLQQLTKLVSLLKESENI